MQGGTWVVLPQILKSGSGHRLEACGPSNGRHKLSYGHPDCFALLRSAPSAIDALDTFHETNIVFIQFLRSVGTVFVFLLPVLV